MGEFSLEAFLSESRHCNENLISEQSAVLILRFVFSLVLQMKPLIRIRQQKYLDVLVNFYVGSKFTLSHCLTLVTINFLVESLQS